ncbi:MAG: LacI family DNA-binding transcriptional regulator [Alphaproteobacteria bacterium]
MPGRRPTIRHVATRAGVSVGTVSNVLNGDTPVSEARRAAVLDAIAALGFRPNGVAQSLRRRQSRVVGLMATGAASAYFAALLESFEDIAARQGYEVMQVLSRGDPELEARRVGALLARQVDGLIMVPTQSPERSFDLIAAAGVPAVMVDRAYPDPRFDYVTMDNDAAMRATVAALAGAGHRRLLYVVRWPGLVTTRARIDAFHAAASARGLAAGTLARDPDDGAFAAQLARALRGRGRPDAIIASNSDLALPMLAALQGLGVAPGRDIGLLVFDEPAWATVVAPPLAVVRHPVAAIARSAWEILIERMERGGGDRRRVVHAAEVVMRGSALRQRGVRPPRR